MPLRHHLLSGAVVTGLLFSANAAYAASQPLSASIASTPATQNTYDSQKTDRKMMVNIVDVTNLRKGPSLKAEIVKKAQPGQAYPIIGWETSSDGNWYLVSLSEKETAYVASWVVETNSKAQAEVRAEGWSGAGSTTQSEPGKEEDTKDDTDNRDDELSESVEQKTVVNIIYVTNIRAEPSLDAEIIVKAQPGQTYTVTGSEGDWYSIALADGTTAYVANWVVSTTVLKDNVEQDANSQVFIYHTHNRESWNNVARNKSGSSVDDPTTNIALVGKELGKILQQKGIGSIVADDDIMERLKLQNLSYSRAYAESRKIIEKTLKTVPALSYFFDIHRDADIPYSQTTAIINGKAYARILFVIGTANPNYKENAKFAEELHQLLEQKYPGLSRGVLVKNAHQGNGEYNQSISPGSILLEFGGVNNTLEENLLTAGAFADAFAEYYKTGAGG